MSSKLYEFNSVMLEIMSKHRDGCLFNKYRGIDWCKCLNGAEDKVSLKDTHDFRIALENFKECKMKCSILILGIDEFKEINDLYSYSFGDRVLSVFSQKILNLIPENAELYRLDGDCFGIIFCNSDVKSAINYYNTLKKSMVIPITIDDICVSFTVSGGVSVFPDDGENGEILYRNTRMALRTAKTKGKNQIVKYSEEILKKEQFKLRILGSLRESVKMGFKGFSLRYQPLIRVDNGKLYGCEALLRWSHPDFPQGVSPYEFIPVLESSGLILDVGKWVLESAVRQCEQWKNIAPDLQMNINVSGSQFESEDFRFFVIDILTKYNVKPSKITLELTESDKIIDTNEMQNVFDFIRGQGVKIALDDFGTGYASLGVFRVLSADELKIDKSFLERLSYNVTDQKIITQIINLCHSMNMDVCVEGIESYETENIITALGADFLQGYYYNCPMTAEEFCKFYFLDTQASIDHTELNLGPEHEQSMVYAPFRPVQPMTMEELIDNTHAGIMQVGMDHEFTFITCNEGYRRMLGYTAKEMNEKFKNYALWFVHPDDIEYVNNEIRRQLSLGDTVTIEFRVVKSDGTPIWILGTGNVVKSRYGYSSLIVVIVDNDSIKKKNIAIGTQHDEMTGLFNKGAVEENVRRIISSSDQNQKYALYIIDIDAFKQINDEIGHINGDKIICGISSRLKKLFGGDDIIGRIGGDEFFIFIQYTDDIEIHELSKSLINDLCKKIIIDEAEYYVSVSMGIACYPADGIKFYDLLKSANGALYRAKALGKGRYCFATK